MYGIVTHALSRDPTPNREFSYRIVVAPELALLAHSSQSQTYGVDGPVTIVDVIGKEMRDANKAGSSTGSARGARNLDYETRISPADYPQISFAFQYRESDLNFLSRMCERYGIFFWFDHGGSKEKIIFGDRREHFAQLAGRRLGLELPYRSAQQIRSRGEFAVFSFNAHYSAQAGTIQLREYLDEAPNADLSVSQPAPFKGYGVQVGYGENYTTQGDGLFFAARRAEALASARLRFRGASNIPHLRPGTYFKLADHPIDTFAQQYVVVEVEHRVTEQTPLGFSAPDKEHVPYSNSFVCVPLDQGYRPPQRTPKPVVSGYLLAIVDGQGDGRAELDSQGRYRIRLLDDESGRSGGHASHLVRKLEPHGGGDGYGTHFPLLVGTEVAVGFLRGDPDRPIILGALHNGENNSTVTSANHTVNRIRTASGIVFQISDGSA